VRHAVADVDVEHLVNEHGINRSALPVSTPRGRDARRNLTLLLEMKHSADHAQRKVGHDHG
jgi:hypothetical protein